MNAREKLLIVIETLLEKKELDKITVSEIVNEAHLCRKSFYRNFADKYELADYYFKQFFDETFGKIICGENFDVALFRYLEICETKATILKNAYISYFSIIITAVICSLVEMTSGAICLPEQI